MGRGDKTFLCEEGFSWQTKMDHHRHIHEILTLTQLESDVEAHQFLSAQSIETLDDVLGVLRPFNKQTRRRPEYRRFEDGPVIRYPRSTLGRSAVASMLGVHCFCCRIANFLYTTARQSPDEVELAHVLTVLSFHVAERCVLRNAGRKGVRWRTDRGNLLREIGELREEHGRMATRMQQRSPSEVASDEEDRSESEA